MPSPPAMSGRVDMATSNLGDKSPEPEAEARAWALVEQLAQLEAERPRPWWKRLLGG